MPLTNFVRPFLRGIETIWAKQIAVLVFSSMAVCSAHAQVLPDLTGLGVFEHHLPAETISRIAPELWGDDTRFSLTIGPSGKPEHCTYVPAHNGLPQADGSRLCGELIHYGIWQMPTWHGPFMRGGRITFALKGRWNDVLRRPVHLTAARKGAPVELFRSGEKCVAYEWFLKDEDVDTLCKQAIASHAEFAPNDAGALVAKLWVAVDARDRQFDLMAEPWIRDIDMPVRYAVDPPLADEVLWPEQGVLVTSFDQLDYPREALLHEISGLVKVLVGFDRAGTPKSCRPLRSDNSTYLGNATCRIAMQRVSFDFQRDVPQFEGERYYAVPVNWVIPE